MEVICNNKVIKIKKCETFKERLMGFMFKKNRLEYGLYFPNCKSIHTFFCFQNLDVVMTDKDNNILYFYQNIKPNKIILSEKGVENIYEFSTGLISDNIVFK